MAKQKTVFVCQNCGNEFPKWSGKCSACGEWNTLVEEQPISAEIEKKAKINKDNVPKPMKEISLESVIRMKTGINELDEVCGGGLVPGSLILLGGEPGIGKSTILLQMALAMGKENIPVLYISGEESASQVKMRAERLGEIPDNILMASENSLENILYHGAKSNIKVLVVDSIQTIYSDLVSSAPGSVSQVRYCGGELLKFAKERNITVILVGHVTKEGTLAGPRVLEHMVDTVLYFEGEKQGALRLLRGIKNRFGSTNEIGVFEMTSEGLMPLHNPSEVFLSNRAKGVAGSAVGVAMQGTRPVLLEIQALTAPTAFGNPRRIGSGVEYNRMLIIIAVLEKKLGLKLSSQDIYVNVTGGVNISDPALDMAIAGAICSAYTNRPIGDDVVMAGEIGLTGELRYASQGERRIKEASKFSFTTFLTPKGKNLDKIKEEGKIQIIEVKSVEKALVALGLIG